jgi:hypothetical protein
MNDSIRCPSCGSAVPLTDAIEHQVEAALRLRLKGEIEQREADHAEALKAQEAELRASFGKEQEQREQELAERARAGAATEVADLKAQVSEQSDTLEAMRNRELEHLKEKRELEETRANLDLELARRLEAERGQIAAQATQRLTGEHRLKLAERDQQIDQMTKQITELKESSEQRRAGLIGEVLEREIEDVLCERFPTDRIEAIKAGARGADVLQGVRSPRGHECGTIYWEGKRAKAWDNGWIAKLKSDQAERKADVAVLVSTTLPAGVERMEFRDGIWIVDPSCVAAIATALRQTLLRLDHQRAIESSRHEVQDTLFEYVASEEFAQHLRASMDAAFAMQADLEAEKRSFFRQMKKREKLLELFVFGQAGMYGDLQGIMGGALAPVESLELPAEGTLRELPPPAAA